MNENSVVQRLGESVQRLGERVATLEAVNTEMRLSLDHLHDCVHEVKNDVKSFKQDVSIREKIWDKRWYIGVGLVGGVLAVSGLSLGKLFELISKIHP